jgi:hypothetical protein
VRQLAHGVVDARAGHLQLKRYFLPFAYS